MSYAQRMIQAIPNGSAVEDNAALVKCIEACFD